MAIVGKKGAPTGEKLGSLNKGAQGHSPYKKEKQQDFTFAKGGNTPMFGQGDRTVTASQEQAGEQTPGGTAHKPSGHSADKYAEGGKTKMFGYTPSQPAQSGITSAR